MAQSGGVHAVAKAFPYVPQQLHVQTSILIFDNSNSQVRIVTSAVDPILELRQLKIQEVDPNTGETKTREKKCWAILPGGEAVLSMLV